MHFGGAVAVKSKMNRDGVNIITEKPEADQPPQPVRWMVNGVIVYHICMEKCALGLRLVMQENCQEMDNQ